MSGWWRTVRARVGLLSSPNSSLMEAFLHVYLSSRLIYGLIGVPKLRCWILHVGVRRAPGWFRWQRLVGLGKSWHAICMGVKYVQCAQPFCVTAMYCSRRGSKWITVTSVRLRWQLTRTQPWCSSKRVSMPTQEIFYNGKKAWQLLMEGEGEEGVWSHQHAEWQFTRSDFGKIRGNGCTHMSQSRITGNKHQSFPSSYIVKSLD